MKLLPISSAISMTSAMTKTRTITRSSAKLHAYMLTEMQLTAVAAIGNQLQQFCMSFLAGHDEKAIEGKISAIDNLLMFETVCLRTTTNPTQIKAIESKMLTLQDEWCELSLKLSNASDTTLKLAGLAPGTAFPQLPIQHNVINPPPATIVESASPTTPTPPITIPPINTAISESSQPQPLPLPIPIQHAPLPESPLIP